VNRLLSIFFLSAYLTGASLPADVINELSKWDVLVTHYQEHRAQTPTLSFPEFLLLHYGDDFKQHALEHNHSSLPGKHSDDVPPLVVSGITALLPPNTDSFKVVVLTNSCSKISTKAPHLLSLFAGNGVWQPPRSA
jgi:hypothetical protein